MEDHPGGRLPGGDGHVEGGGDQAGAHVPGDRPADHGPRVQVDDGGQVGPAVPGPDVGDVAAPAGVGVRGGEVAADQVRRGCRMFAADGGPLPRPRVTSSQASGLHEPVDALVRHHVPEGGQARAQAADTRVTPGQLVYLPHDRDEGAVVFLPLGRLGAAPGVVAGPGHAEPGAHERHRIGVRISPVRDGSESYCLPFANQVATFFANSTCIRSSLIVDLSSWDSARRRISSARSDSPSGASGDIPAAAASRATFTHLPRVISWTPMLRATSATGRPPSRTKATDCSLYSGVNARRVEPISRSPGKSGQLSRVSTEAGTVQICRPGRAGATRGSMIFGIRWRSRPSWPGTPTAVMCRRGCRSCPPSWDTPTRPAPTGTCRHPPSSWQLPGRDSTATWQAGHDVARADAAGLFH